MFTEEERKTILELARATIQEYLSTGRELTPPSDPFLSHPAGLFVTLKIEGELRGCIGLTEPKYSLGRTIVHCAIQAAVHDPRFPPLSMAELAQTRLEVSVLSGFQTIRDVNEIQVGVHGLFITSGFHRGLLLPQVATEQKWDRDTFLRYVCMKAGLSPEAWKSPGVTIEVFTAEVFGEED